MITALLYTRAGFYEKPAEAWVSALIIAALMLPLAARRRHPEIVAVVVAVAFFACQILSVPELLFSNIALFVAIYSVGAWSVHRRAATVTRIAIIIGMFVWVAVSLVMTVSDPELAPGVSRAGVFSQFAAVSVIQVITNLLYFGGAYYFGNTAFTAARERAELVARTAELADERELSSQQAVTLDRVRIARELHDVVAHHVSAMGVQAGAARRVLPTDPERAGAALTQIEQSARSAITELHRLLTTLRDTGTDATDSDAANESSSTRGVEQLPDLLAVSRAAGIPTTMRVIGEPRALGGLVGFTLYRVAQEGLTNIRKHAGDRATVDVRLRYLDDSVELEIADTGQGQGLASPDGHGLGQVGMRERVAAVGGSLEVGPRSRGGYLVRAVVPDGGGT